MATARAGSVLILGATSAIARGACAELGRRGYNLVLAGRHRQALQRNAADLRNRYGVAAEVAVFDAADVASHADFVAAAAELGGDLAGVFLAFGCLGDQDNAARDFDEAAAVIHTNFTGAASVLTHCANRLAARGDGFIIAISSVAADRGRQSNYVYGSAKAGLDAFLSGLRNRLHHHGVRVITVRPGFVDTPMTRTDDAPVPTSGPGKLLVADPDEVGRDAVAALDGGADVVYLPWFWRPIMRVIKWIPEPVFKRLRL